MKKILLASTLLLTSSITTAASILDNLDDGSYAGHSSYDSFGKISHIYRIGSNNYWELLSSNVTDIRIEYKNIGSTNSNHGEFKVFDSDGIIAQSGINDNLNGYSVYAWKYLSTKMVNLGNNIVDSNNNTNPKLYSYGDLLVNRSGASYWFFDIDSSNVTSTEVPEPTSFALLGLGLLAMRKFNKQPTK